MGDLVGLYEFDRSSIRWFLVLENGPVHWMLFDLKANAEREYGSALWQAMIGTLFVCVVRDGIEVNS